MDEVTAGRIIEEYTKKQEEERACLMEAQGIGDTIDRWYKLSESYENGWYVECRKREHPMFPDPVPKDEVPAGLVPFVERLNVIWAWLRKAEPEYREALQTGPSLYARFLRFRSAVLAMKPALTEVSRLCKENNELYEVLNKTRKGRECLEEDPNNKEVFDEAVAALRVLHSVLVKNGMATPTIPDP